MAVQNMTRIQNILLMQAIEKNAPEIVDQLVEEKFKEMCQEEISFMLQDGMMGTFKDDGGKPLKLSNKTLQKLMLYKLDQFIDEKESENG